MTEKHNELSASHEADGTYREFPDTGHQPTGTEEDTARGHAGGGRAC